MRYVLCTAALVAVATSSGAPPVPPINNTCLAGCIKKGDFIDIAELCTSGARQYLTTCSYHDCYTDWRNVKKEFERVCPHITEPTTPSPRPTPFPWTFKNKCFEQCVNEGPWLDARALCAPGASVSLSSCRVNRCLDVSRDAFFQDYGDICTAWRYSTTTTSPSPTSTCPAGQTPDYRGICRTATSTNTCRPDQTVDYRGFCRCPDGYTTDYRGFCRTGSPTPTPTCRPDQILDYRGFCRCPDSATTDYRGFCRMPSPTTTTPCSITSTTRHPCAPGYTSDYRGSCRPISTTVYCPSGYTLDQRGVCVSVPPTPSPTPIPCQWHDHVCKCPPGFHHDYRGWCRPDVATTSSSSTKVCPTGTRLDEHGNCVPLVPTSPTPTVTSTQSPIPCSWNSYSCACPSGYHHNYRGLCIPDEHSTTPICPPGSQLGPDGKCHPYLPPTSTITSTSTPTPIPCNWQSYSCVCPSGYHNNYRGLCIPDDHPTTPVCPPGSQLGADGKCHPFLPPTSTPPYPCHNGTWGCASHPPHPPRPTGTVTKVETVTKIETLTWCPPNCRPCHGQTTTWTYTFGPTSCPPIKTCTCVLPTGSAFPTLTECPASVTCTGQTTTLSEEETVTLPGTVVTPGETVVLPSETLPPWTTDVPAGPTPTATGAPDEFPGKASRPLAGGEAVGVFIAAILGSMGLLVVL